MLIQFIEEYWKEALYSGMTSLLCYGLKICYLKLTEMVRQQEKIAERMDKIERTQGVLLYDRFFQCCKHLLYKGTASPSEIVNLEHLYNEYKDAGFKVGMELYHRCLKLRTVEEDENLGDDING